MRRTLLVGVSVVLALAVGCSRPKPIVAPEVSRPTEKPTPAAKPAESREVMPEPEVQPASRPESEVAGTELPADVEVINKKGYLKDVFFDTDKADLRPDAREMLAQNASWLLRQPTVKVLVEGHCDERNTNEYNLALGWRRANAVRDYLISLGVSGERISTISYGEERPFATCHDESCWWQNRRAHFVVTAK